LRKLDAYRVHLLQTMLMSIAASLIWTAMEIFRITVLGLSPLQLVLVGTTMEATIFLFEIPTGIVADMYSRRLSTIIGYVVLGFAYVFEGLLQRFEATMAAQVIWGIGYTFTSGAYDAWLVDEIGQERTGQAFLRGSQVSRIAGLVGMGVSVWLGNIDLRIPIILGGLLTVLIGLLLALVMPENGFKPTPAEDRNTWQRMGDTFREGVRVIRQRPTLMSILAIGIFIGLYSEGWDRLWEKHLLDTFHLERLVAMKPITFFAILSVALMGLSVVITEIIRRRVNTNNPRLLSRTLFWLVTAMVVSIAAFGLSPLFSIALVTFFVFSLARAQIGPLFSTWSNQHIESQVRATVLSMQSQTDAIGQIVGGPPIGAVGQLSLRAAFVVSGAILSPAAYLLHRLHRRESTQIEPVAGLAEAQ
jgi:MFS transporter, DHA3 family, tetracycline resistance protein